VSSLLLAQGLTHYDVNRDEKVAVRSARAVAKHGLWCSINYWALAAIRYLDGLFSQARLN